ncbi:MAG TPA: hypothetical protein VGF84_15055 [Micromonosporaceae bacterium]
MTSSKQNQQDDVLGHSAGTSMVSALAAGRPRAEYAPALRLYGQLVGEWDVTNRYFVEDPPGSAAGGWRTGTVVWTFGWILAGIAVQDVMWFTKDDGAGGTVTTTGSTMRLYDPGADVWHVVWFSPAGTTCTMIGRPGPDGGIVQDGHRADGRPIRWSFIELTDRSFRWLGHVSDDDGATWRLEQEMHARRRDTPHHG